MNSYKSQNTHKLSGFLIFLFSLTAAMAVGNLYWAQPLLASMADTFKVPSGSAGILVTATQLGYAFGILLIVPLGDIRNRRKLIPLIMLFSAVALSLISVAPTFPILLVAMTLTGITTVAGQLLTPFASDLSSPEERGRVTGTIVSGMLIGILLSRTISGVIADYFGWRAVFMMAAAVIFVLTLMMFRFLPVDKPRTNMRYGTLMISAMNAVRENKKMWPTLYIGFCAFMVFTLFWTSLTFMLSEAPYSYNLSQIGMTGLAGLAGALIARRAGVLYDKGYAPQVTGLSLVLALLSLISATLGAHQIVVIILAIIALDIAIQTLNVLNQTHIISLNPAMRSRLNTIFVVCNFIGGAIGSMLAGGLWHAGGWNAVMSGAVIILLSALSIWFHFRNKR